MISVIIDDNKYRHTHRSKTHNEAFALISTHIGDVACYSVHLDPHYTGARGRVKQFTPVFEDAVRQNQPLVVMAGDFNTVCHGLARLIPCTKARDL
jgi:hypothetical protein